MKKILSLFLMISMLVLTSCGKDMLSDVENLKARVAALETACKDINSSISATNVIVKALEDNDMIRNISSYSENGKTNYLLTFVSGATVTLIQGVDGQNPVIGLMKYDDGRYYWTVQNGTDDPTWLLSSLGLKMKASGVAPKMDIVDGWWVYSYDEGVSWVRLCKANGDAGTSIFENIEIYDLYVTFTIKSDLLGDKMIQLPTEEYFNMIVEKCENINNDIDVVTSLLSEIDTTVAVKSISQISSGDTLLGYKLLLNNGTEFSIMTGKDALPFSLAIIKDNWDFVDYWAIKMEGDSDYSWVYKENGEKAKAEGVSGTPIIGAKDSLGVFYYTYCFPSESEKWLRDANNDLVRASAYDNLSLFTSLNLGTNDAEITLADGSKVLIPLYTEIIPNISFQAPEGITYDSATYLYSKVKTDTTYTVTYQIDNANANVAIDAIGMDEAVVTQVTKELSGSTITGSIKFKTPVSFPQNAVTTRVLVFVTWNSSVTMKVLEFKNR